MASLHGWFGLDSLDWYRQRFLAYCRQNQFFGSERTGSPNCFESCLSFLLLGSRWVQGRRESDVALIEDPQGNPDPEGVEEEKIDPSVRMSASLSWLLSERGRGRRGEQVMRKDSA